MRSASALLFGGIAVHLALTLWSSYASLPGGSKTFQPCSADPCGPQAIPKIIHQTYKTADLPHEWKATPMHWQKQHPGWKYMLWTDETNRKLVQEHYPEHLVVYDAYPHGIQRADAARYFILHHYGGVYADLDIRPLKHIGPMLGDAQVLLPQTPNIGLTNAFMASTKGHPFFAHVISKLKEYQHAWYHFTRHWEIVTATGPTFIWSVFDRFASDRKAGMLVVPARVWGKCSICKTSCRVSEYGYLQHLVGDSWHKWDSFIINYIVLCNTVPLVIALYIVISALQSRRAVARKVGPSPGSDRSLCAVLLTRENFCLCCLAVVCWHLKRRP
eukprot:g3736.t1